VDVECAGVMTSHTQDVKRVVWHPHEDLLASASYDDTIKLYVHDENDGDWTTVATLSGHSSTVWSIDFDGSGNRLASASDDKTIKIWQRTVGGGDWSCVSTLGGHHTRPIYGIAWNKSNGLIATASGDNSIRILKELRSANELDRNLFEVVSTVKTAHQLDVNNVAWNPTWRNYLASIGDDGKVKLWKWQECDDDVEYDDDVVECGGDPLPS
jgi:WD40 repeat protein